MGSKAYFISDIHLENMQERNGEILLRFLHSLAEQKEAPDLYLLGDIFDFWVSGHKVFIKKFAPLFEPIKKIKEKGGKLYFFEGNHDLHLHTYWQKKLGFEVYVQPQYQKIGNFVVRLEHGDEMNPADEAYRKWRAFYRHPIIAFLGHTLPGLFWDWLGEKLSAISRKKSRVYRADHVDFIKGLIRAHGKVAYAQKPFDLIISGHMHIKYDEFFETAQGPVRNINLGAWIEKNEPYALCIEGSEVSWIKLS